MEKERKFRFRISSLVLGTTAGALLSSLLFLLAYFLRLGKESGSSIVLPGLLISLLVLILFILFFRFLLLLKKLVTHPILSYILGGMATIVLMLVITGKFLPLSILIALLIVPLPTLLGFAVGLYFHRKSRYRSHVPYLVFLAAVFLLNTLFFFWLFSSGTTGHLVSYEPARDPYSRFHHPSDPSEPGEHTVSMIYYGSGRDRQRFTYSNLISIATQPVNIIPFLPSTSGFQRSYRERYWGFDINRIPLNGVVWFPQSEERAPLVIIVHGNHSMYTSSELGYEYLGKLLASRGYIVVSLDQNFLNFSRLGEGFSRQELAARSWLILEHLKLWHNWQNNPNNPFYGRVDLDNIALIGHSRGGEAAAIAALFNRLSHYPDNSRIAFDYDFSIKSVIALAPSEGFYKPSGQPLTLKNINYLQLQGAADGDLMVYLGTRQYNRVIFADDDDFRFKALVYINRANHGYFNSKWGRTDLSFPAGWLLNRKQIMPEDEQQQIAKVFISAFLDATLREERGYIHLFRNSDLFAEWLPDTIYLNRYEDSSYELVANFGEDVDLTTTSIPDGRISATGFQSWREDILPLRYKKLDQGAKALYLTWRITEGTRQIPHYTIDLPVDIVTGWSLTEDSSLLFSMASTDLENPETPDLSIELTTTDGLAVSLPLSRFRNPLPPLILKSTKLNFLENSLLEPAEIIPNTYVLPLAAFKERDDLFAPERIRRIRFIFNIAPVGEIALTDIGFSNL